jgi:hypothetical protein
VSGARRAIRALIATSALAVLAVPPVPSVAAPKAKDTGAGLSYTIREARAYAYRATLRKEVIEGARRARPCDPNTDPYQCDTAQYEHQPNCSEAIAVGPKEEVPAVRPVPGARPAQGGTGDQRGGGSEPPTASPITLNELLTLAHLGRTGSVREAGGLASDSYVDLSGRQDPTLHTESDIVTGFSRYEERCLSDAANRSYRHLLSRTDSARETYHLAECRKDQCTFDRLTFSAQDVMARTIVHLREEGGKVIGSIQATFNDATWGTTQAFAADSIDTVLTFESDGTAEGLKWSVGTTAQGARLGGQPVALPTGRMTGTPDLQAGVAEPFVRATEDGSSLRIIAPGVIVASREQTAWFGGAEIDATFGSGTPGGGGAPLRAGGGGGAAADDEGGGGGGRGGNAPAASGSDSAASGEASSIDPGSSSAGPGGTSSLGTIPAAAPVAQSEETRSVSRFETVAPFFLIVVAGVLAALWIVLRWMRQFPAGRALYTYPPFTLIDRLYRTFAKS